METHVLILMALVIFYATWKERSETKVRIKFQSSSVRVSLLPTGPIFVIEKFQTLSDIASRQGTSCNSSSQVCVGTNADEVRERIAELRY